MKYFLLLMALLGLVSCGQGFNTDKEDSTLTGKVSVIWNNIVMSAAYANSDKKQDPGDWEGRNEDPESVLDQLSAALSQREIFALSKTVDQTTGYQGIVSESLGVVQDLQQSVSTRLPEPVRPLFSGLTDKTQFEYGMGMALGFNSQQQIVSLITFNLSKDLTYSFKDSQEGLVDYYTLSFIFPGAEGNVEYRKTIKFIDGSRVENVDFAKTAAAMAVFEAIAPVADQDLNLKNAQLANVSREKNENTVALMKNVMQEKYEILKSSNQFTSDERDAVKSFLKVAYDSNFETQLNQVQKSIAYASMFSAIRSDNNLREAIVSSKALFDKEEGDFNSLVATKPELLSVSTILNSLVSISMLPPTSKLKDRENSVNEAEKEEVIQKSRGR